MADEDSGTTEVWKSIPGYEGYYSVSSWGRIRRDKAQAGTQAGLILKALVAGNKYPRVYLWKDCVGTNCQIHALVALAFFGPRPEGAEVNHKNGIRTDNRAANLEYVTRQENMRHSRDVLGHDCIGERNPRAKLTGQDIEAIRRAGDDGERIAAIARRFGVGYSQISRILRGEAWRHLSSP